jgi:hypothetical protein
MDHGWALGFRRRGRNGRLCLSRAWSRVDVSSVHARWEERFDQDTVRQARILIVVLVASGVLAVVAVVIVTLASPRRRE